MDKSANVGARPGAAERPHEFGAGAAAAAGCHDRGRRRRCGCCAGRTGNWSRDPPRRNGCDGDGVAAAGKSALTTKPTTGDLESDRLKARLETALIERDLLNERIAILEADRSLVRRRLKPKAGLSCRSAASRTAWHQFAGSGGSLVPAFIAIRPRRPILRRRDAGQWGQRLMRR